VFDYIAYHASLDENERLNGSIARERSTATDELFAERPVALVCCSIAGDDARTRTIYRRIVFQTAARRRAATAPLPTAKSAYLSGIVINAAAAR